MRSLGIIKHDVVRTAEKVTVNAWFKLPPRFRHLLVMSELGHLTATDPRLHPREVPTITVDEIGRAMQYEEAAA
jgi:hypothetical protein